MAPGRRPCRYSVSIRSSKYLHSTTMCSSSCSRSASSPDPSMAERGSVRAAVAWAVPVVPAVSFATIGPALLGCVEGLAGERKVRLADRLGQRRVGVDQGGDL